MTLKIAAVVVAVVGIVILAKGQLIPGALMLTSAMLLWNAEK